MAVVNNLHEQHAELLELARGISSLLDADQLARSCTAVRLNVSAFARKLRVHLELEDRFVCEHLLRHSDPAIVGRVTQHQTDMRLLRDDLAEYTDRWTTAEVEIQKEPGRFVEETKAVLDAASQRFALEERDLYPLVEQILTPSGTWPLDLMSDADQTRNTG